MPDIGDMLRPRCHKMRQVLILAWDFVWISSITLGGGMAMIPFMEREFVERRNWLTAVEMADAVTLTQSLPGLIAINMAVLIGYRVKGAIGAVVSAFAICLVPFVMIVIVAKIMMLAIPSSQIDHIFMGIRAGTAALIAHSLVRLSRPILVGTMSWVLGAVSFIASVIFAVDVAWIVILGLSVGIILSIIGAARRSNR